MFLKIHVVAPPLIGDRPPEPGSSLEKVRKMILDDALDEFSKAMSKQLNDVYGGKKRCCISFSVRFLQAASREYVINDANRLGLFVNDSPKSEEGGAIAIGGRYVNVDSGGLLNGHLFPHEMGHLFGLLHPDVRDMTEAEITRLKEAKYDEQELRDIKSGKESIGLNLIRALIESREGYIHHNPLVLNPDDNVMSWGDSKTSTCEQVSTIIKNIKSRGERSE